MAMDRDAAARFLAERHGASAEDVADLGGGDWSRAFSFRLNGRELVVRFGRHVEDFLKDQAAAAEFAGPDLPVPAVIEVGEAAPELFFAVSERRHGVFLEGLDERGWRTLLPALLRGLDALREATPPGRGVDWAADGSAEPLGWRHWLVASLEDRPGGRVSGWRARLKETPDVEEVFVLAERALRSLLPACPEAPRHLLHRDLLNRNVLVAPDASRLEAVFDWGCSLAGDFVYEVAWLTFWSSWHAGLEAADFRRAARDHHRATGLEVKDFDERLACYELHIGLEHLAYCAFTRRDDGLRDVARRTVQVLDALPPG